MLTLDCAVAVPNEVLHREVDGEVVLLNLESGVYFGLDPVGARMWAVLTQHLSLRLSYEALLEEFDVDPGQLERDLAALLTALGQHGLIEVKTPGR